MSVPRVSLSQLGLHAPDGLECPEGGPHEILEAETRMAATVGGGAPRCQRCGHVIILESLRHLED